MPATRTRQKLLLILSLWAVSSSSFLSSSHSVLKPRFTRHRHQIIVSQPRQTRHCRICASESRERIKAVQSRLQDLREELAKAEIATAVDSEPDRRPNQPEVPKSQPLVPKSQPAVPKSQLADGGETSKDEVTIGTRSKAAGLDYLAGLEAKSSSKLTSEDVLREQISAANEKDTSGAQILKGPEQSVLSPEVLDDIMTERPYLQILLERGLETTDELLQSAKSSWNGEVEEREPPIPKAERPRVVVLGTGWGAYAFLKTIDAEKFDVIVVSPRNYFLFTPMLAGAAVGTVEYRSITEPIRNVNKDADYLESTATNIDTKTKVVTCQSVVCEGMSCDIEEFQLKYDQLVIGVGATTNTFGTPGVSENCAFLKQIEDASRVRKGIGNVFERANIPDLTDKQREQALTFVTIGAGPTGVEFTSELRDFMQQDASRYYPHLLKHVKLVLIEATNRILGAFDEDMANAALNSLEDQEESGTIALEVITGVGVKEVKEREILLADGRSIPYGIAVWAAGNGPLPLILDTIENIPEQKRLVDAGEVPPGGRGRLLVDGWLRVSGAQGVYAVGDCAVMRSQPLPATAQVASQQATFLGRLLSGDYDTDAEAPVAQGPNIRASDKVLPKTNAKKDNLPSNLRPFLGNMMLSEDGDTADRVAKPFQFLNLGILAYVGNDRGIAQLKIGETPVKSKGVAGWLLWRSIYLSKQVSWRNRILVSADWVKTKAFGRDITRL